MDLLNQDNVQVNNRIEPKQNHSITLLSPARIVLKNPIPSSSLLKSPPVRQKAKMKSFLCSPVRTPSEAATRNIRKSPRLLEKSYECELVSTDNPFFERNDALLQAVDALSIDNASPSPSCIQLPHNSNDKVLNNGDKVESTHHTHAGNSQSSVNHGDLLSTIITSSPNRQSKLQLGKSIPVLPPTGKTPKSTRSVTISNGNLDSDIEDGDEENSMRLSNANELFSPGFHGEATASHQHSPCFLSRSSMILDSQHLADSISNEFSEPSAIELEFYDSEEYSEGIAYIASLPSPTRLAPHPFHGSKPVLPSLPSSKITLVLDLDETLVHCSDDKLVSYDISFVLAIPGRDSPIEVYVRWRPHLYSFLEELKKRSEDIDVILFTASQRIYAKRVLALMDPDGSIFSHALFRESCRFLDGSFVKDLGILGRSLTHTLIVDNSLQAFALHPENGYAIPSWFEDPEDDELPRLLSFLDNLICRTAAFPDSTDIRHVLRRRFPIYNSVQSYKTTLDSSALETLLQISV